MSIWENGNFFITLIAKKYKSQTFFKTMSGIKGWSRIFIQQEYEIWHSTKIFKESDKKFRIKLKMKFYQQSKKEKYWVVWVDKTEIGRSEPTERRILEDNIRFKKDAKTLLLHYMRENYETPTSLLENTKT